jgi:hypothetical protein
MNTSNETISLFDAVHDLIGRNESVYNANESAISSYMQKRWDPAFDVVMNHNDTDFVPTVGEVADIAVEHIEDPKKFLDDFETVLRGLSKGCRLQYGEFV